MGELKDKMAKEMIDFGKRKDMEEKEREESITDSLRVIRKKMIPSLIRKDKDLDIIMDGMKRRAERRERDERIFVRMLWVLLILLIMLVCLGDIALIKYIWFR